MAMTAAERSKRYRERKRDGDIVTQGSSVTEDIVTNPLDVYSEGRWAYLSGKGYEWDADRGRAVLDIGRLGKRIGVVVPGDPGYRGVLE